MLNFDDDAHEFHVDLPAPATVGLDFGNRLFVTSMVTLPNMVAIETALAARTPLFNSGLVPDAILFFASSVVVGKDNRPLNEAQLKAGFEFGFVQGIQSFDIHLDYWGQRKSNGTTAVHIGMPATFEVDTETSIQPWTRIASKRFKVERAPPRAGKPAGLKVSAGFSDHPLYFFPHTITNAASVTRFLRFISTKRVFRPIFCFRDKATGDFEAISSSVYVIQYRHQISYSDNGATRTVIDNAAPHVFPSGGNPANINADDRQLMTMAKAGSPLMTPQVLSTRLHTHEESEQETNDDFDPSFWR